MRQLDDDSTTSPVRTDAPAGALTLGLTMLVMAVVLWVARWMGEGGN